MFSLPIPSCLPQQYFIAAVEGAEQTAVVLSYHRLQLEDIAHQKQLLAHTIGEFGVVLMIGGNIPRKTQVVSTEIYTYVEAMEYSKAHVLAGGMLIFSFIVLMTLNLLNKRTAEA